MGNYHGTKIARVDPVSKRVSARVEVGFRPLGLAAGDDSVWVAGYGTQTVSRIDPGTNKVTAKIDVGGTPESAAIGPGAV